MQVIKETDKSLVDWFCTSLELEDLARIQGVVAMKDIRALFGTWPGEPDDDFAALIDDLRSKEGQRRVE